MVASLSLDLPIPVLGREDRFLTRSGSIESLRIEEASPSRLTEVFLSPLPWLDLAEGLGSA